MKELNIRFEGNGYTVKYKIETVDLNIPSLPFVNVYSVFIDDQKLSEIAGSHFTVLQNFEQIIQPAYAKNNPADIQENNLKKLIGQQILNDNKK